MKRFTITLFGIFVFTGSILSFEGYRLAPHSKGIVPFNIKGVQLLTENVDIYFDSTVCVYLLKNLNREKVEFRMGLPFQYNAVDSQLIKRLIAEDTDYLDFEVFAGEELLNSTLMLSKTEKHDIIFLWNVTILANEEIEIKCRYSTIWDKHSSGWGDNSISLIYYRCHMDEWHDKVIESNFYFHFTDMLADSFDTTNWRQEFLEPQLNNFIYIKPDPYFINWRAKTIEWHEFNVDTTQDITVKIGKYNRLSPNLEAIYDDFKESFSSGYIRDELAEKIDSEPELLHLLSRFTSRYVEDGNPEFIGEEWFQRIAYRFMRNYYFAKNGWIFEDELLNRIFADVQEGVERKEFRDFTMTEKHNITFIKEYEDKNFYNFDE